MKKGVLTPETVDNEPEEKYDIGVWGRRHLRLIRQHKNPLYLDLFLSGKLNAYLADVNVQAEDMFARLINDMAAREGVTEKLKAEDQMHWVQEMNRISAMAREVVHHDLIFV